MSVNEEMTALADAIRAKTGQTGKMTIEKMTIAVEGLVVTDDDIKLQDKVITENGTYTADNGYHGFGEVRVAVENEPILPELQDKVITENGEYEADNGYYGFGKVTVNVPSITAKTLGVTIRNNTGKLLSVVYYVKSEGKIEMRQSSISGQASLACVDGTHLSLIAEDCMLSLDNYAGNLLLISNQGNRADFLVTDQGEGYATMDILNGGALGEYIEFTENGTYTAEGLYGYRSVSVNVSETPLQTVMLGIINDTGDKISAVYYALVDGVATKTDHMPTSGNFALECVSGTPVYIKANVMMSFDAYYGDIEFIVADENVALFKIPERPMGDAPFIGISSAGSFATPLNVTKNGTYNAPGAYGFSPVVVEVDNTGGAVVETCRVHILFEGGFEGAKIHYTGIDDNSGTVSDFVINNVGVNYGDICEFYAVKGSILAFEGWNSGGFYNGDEIDDVRIFSADGDNYKRHYAFKVTRDIDFLPA